MICLINLDGKWLRLEFRLGLNFMFLFFLLFCVVKRNEKCLGVFEKESGNFIVGWKIYWVLEILCSVVMVI